MTNQCKNCQFFQRGKWHKSIDKDESEQLGGYCPLLTKILGMDNPWMWDRDVQIQDSFGCSLFKNKQ